MTLKQLEIHSRFLSDPIVVNLPLDNASSESQSLFDQFDPNSNGRVHLEIDSNLTPDQYRRAEISTVNNRHFDFNSAARFSRQFRNFIPPDQKQLIYYDRLFPLLETNPEMNVWQTAKKILVILGDYHYLTDLAWLARDYGHLELAEDCLLNAYPLASTSREGRKFLEPIDLMLNNVKKELEMINQEQFQKLKNKPYLLAGPLSPVTFSKNNALSFSVAVPPSFIEKNGGDIEQALIDFYTTGQQIKAVSEHSTLELIPTFAILDESHPFDDREGTFSPHLNQERLDNGVFGQEMVYFHVEFFAKEVGDSVKTPQKYDLQVWQNKELVRTEKGALVLQTEGETTVRMAVAADLHVSLDDWKMIRDIVENGSIDTDAAEAVEHFYASANEKVIALLEETDNQFRRGEISRLILAGDLYDYAHTLVTLEPQGYYFTNARLFAWMIENTEIPIYGIYGNHEWHGQRFPPNYHHFNFPLKPDLNKHLHTITEKYFPMKGNVIEAWNALSFYPTRNPPDFPLTFASKILNDQKNNWDKQLDEEEGQFINHYAAHLGPYDSYSVDLLNGFRLYFMPTGPEDVDAQFLAQTFGKRLLYHLTGGGQTIEEMKTYSLKADIKEAIAKAATETHLNGRGPGGENLVALSLELEGAQQNNELLLVVSHFPLFNNYPFLPELIDQEDVLEEETNWALRMMADYYRTPEGKPVLASHISGHLHRRQVNQFHFVFTNPEDKEHYYQETGDVLARKNPATFIHDLHQIRKKFELDQKIKIGQSTDIDFFHQTENDDQTAFVTVQAAGRDHEGDETGYAVVTLDRENGINWHFRNLTVTPSGEVVDMPYLRDYQEFRRSDLEKWDREHEEKDGHSLAGTSGHPPPQCDSPERNLL